MIFILSLPRSRSKWLSEFLRTDKCKTSHEESFRHDSLESLYNSGYDVVCDTGLILLWKELKGLIILIDRKIDEIYEDCEKIGLNTELLPVLREAFDDAKKSCICIPYEDLKKEETCRMIFESVTKEQFDRERWQKMDKEIILCDIEAIKEELKLNQHKYEKLYGKRG